MRESWIDKTDSVIRDDIVSIAKEKTGLTNFKSTGVLRGFIEVLAAVVFFIYKTAINPIYSNAALDGASGVFLSFWGLMLGVVRKQNSKTSGNFTGASYASGKIPSGSWIVIDGTELRYKVTADVSFQADTTFPVPVIAEFAGGTYNVGPETAIRITRVISGLDTLTVGGNWIVETGQDDEEDDLYRERIRARWRSQILGDTKTTYQYYAESVNGVREAKIIRTPRGPGTTDIIIAAVNGVPESELLEAVEAALEDHELMAFDVRVKAPDATPVQVTIEFSGDADAGDVQIIAEQYAHELGIGGRFVIRDLYTRYEPLNLATVEILSPDRDVQAAANSIIQAAISVTKTGAVP
jgi:uncharacterized phage protein gp47/JayE